MKTLPFIFNAILIILLFGACKKDDSKSFKISINIDKDLTPSAATKGRMFILMTQNPDLEPRTQLWPNPVNPTHIFAHNFSDLDPKDDILVQNLSEWQHTSDWDLSNIPEGEYYIQALWDQDTVQSRIDAPGNLFSTKQEFIAGKNSSLSLTLDQKIPERTVTTHELVRLVDFKSDTLSAWWGHPVFLKATILLPPDYDPTKVEYPIHYNISGYGDRYDRINRFTKNEEFMNWWYSNESPEVINVFLDGEGPFGDSYQMDSENSGPYGHALIYELIPHIEQKYRGNTSATTRFVDGCSTGGWVSLGLQLYYPDHFNGVFSYSPDAVEFENYNLINIYKDKNAYENEYGYLRPIMRDLDGEPMLSFKNFVQYENILGSSNTYLNSGGQIGAHTALYSPKGENGLPKPLIHPKSGEIDSTVAEHWKKYDFKLYVKENWKELGPKLRGKVYIWMGDMDQFYLNEATREFSKLLESLENPASDAKIEFSATEGHCSKYSIRTILEQIDRRLEEIRE